MKFIYTNKNILPWNYYVNHLKPDPKISGNVYIDKKEWFNSFLPPFFTPNMADVMVKIKNCIERGEDFDYPTYLSAIQNLFAPERVLITLQKMKKQMYDYFELDKKVTKLMKTNGNLKSLLGTVHLGINLSDEFFFPIEGLVTRKRANYDFLAKVIPESLQSNIALRTFNLDSVMLPMVVVSYCAAKKTKVYELACIKVCDLMSCTMPELLQTLKLLERKFQCRKYMQPSDALVILENNVIKITNETRLSEVEKAACILQELNCIITWSKYFPISLKETKTRNYTYTDIVVDLNKDLSLSGSSGSEKHGKLIWLLNNHFQKNEKLKNEVLEYSLKLAKQIFPNQVQDIK